MGKDRYHLSPASLVGQRFGPDAFRDIRIALVGYCPPPQVLERYKPEPDADQHFIHVPPSSVSILRHGGHRFLSLAHVYGGPVSASTVEELAYYGIEYVLAYGLAGGLGTRGLAMADFYMVESALAADGTTPHYTDARIVDADRDLAAAVPQLWAETRGASVTPVRAATGDAIYREDDAMLDGYRAQGCDIVNLDSAHLFAVSCTNSAGRRLKTIQCGVLSDVVTSGPDGHSESTLGAMLSAIPSTTLNPLELTGEIVSFYLETLAPRLAA